MKKIISAILITVLLFSFAAACEKNNDNSSPEWTVTEKNFTGNKERAVELTSDAGYNLLVSAETQEGELKLVIKDENDKVYYTDEKVESGQYMVLLKQYKKYTFYLRGKDYTGTFYTKWVSSEPEEVTKDNGPIPVE